MLRFLVFLFCTLFSLSAFGQFTEAQRQELDGLNNLLGKYNPGFENGLAKWTKTGSSTLAVDASNYYAGKMGAIWDASATSEYLKSVAVTVPDGLKGRSCMAGIQYKWPSGTATHINLQAYDGTNILAQADLTVTTYWLNAYVAFPCPTSGTVQLRLASTADAAVLTLDQAWLGSQTNLKDISQAELYGSLTHAGTASCTWTNVTAASWQNFPVNANCPVPTLVGNALAPDTKVPGIKFSSLPPGKYVVSASGILSSTSAQCQYQISDGTTGSGMTATLSGTTQDISAPIGVFTYTNAQSNITFQLQSYFASGTNCIVYNAGVGFQKFEFSVVRYPLSSQQAVTLETQGIAWQGNHASDCAFIRTNAAYGAFTADATCTFTEITNSNFGTVTSQLSGSDKLPGIVFIPKYTGIYSICAYPNVSSAVASATVSLRLTDGTAVFDENGILEHAADNYVRMPLCALVNISSIASKTLYIEGKASTSNVEMRSGSGNLITWVIYPLTQNFPQAVALTGFKYQIKTLAADQTTDAVMSDLTFTLEAGKTYRITFNGESRLNTASDTSVACLVKDGSTQFGIIKSEHGSASVNNRVTWTIIRTMVNASLTFTTSSSSANAFWLGNSDTLETFVQVEQLPNYELNTGW